MEEQIKNALEEGISTLTRMHALTPAIIRASNILIQAYKEDNKTLLCGNGGSAAEAQHFAAEIVGRYEKERPGRPAIALSTDTSNLTAISNDYGFDAVFARQVEALGQSGDVLIGISTSGNSPNVLRAVEVAKGLRMKIILFLGCDGGKLKGMGDVDLIIPSNRTSRIQEGHKVLTHVLCGALEESFS